MDQKISNQKRILKYFLGYPARKVLYTILGFNSTLSNKTIAKAINKDSNSYVSYFLAFNHATCRIECFMINYGTQNIDLDLRDDVPKETENTRLNFMSKGSTVPDNQWKALEHHQNGKLTLSFFFVRHTGFPNVPA